MWCEFVAGSSVLHTVSENTFRIENRKYLFSVCTSETWWALCKQTEGDVVMQADA